MLIQELVGGDDANAELTSLRKNALNGSRAVGDKILNFIAIESVERPFFAREKSVLDNSEHETSQCERLLPKLPFLKIDDDPIPFVHRLFHRKGRMLLPHDMTEMRIGSKCRGLIEDRLAHGGAHRFACFVIPE